MEKSVYYDAALLTGNHDVQEEYHSDGSAGSDEEGNSNKRKRPMNVTCEACKQRKVKCDRARPACGWCTKNDHPCEYKERKKPGLRAGYGRELEGRLDKLEAALANQARQIAQLERLSGTTTGSQPQAADQSNSIRITPQMIPTHHQYEDENVLRQQILDPQLQTQGPEKDSAPYIGTHLVDNAQSVPHHHPESSPAHTQLTSPRSTGTMLSMPQSGPVEQGAALPPYDLLYSLVDLYFRNINNWFPLLDKKSTLDSLFGPSPLAESERIILHAMVAVALRFSKDTRLTPDNRRQYHETSKQKVQLFCLENSSVQALQALVILALDVTGTTNGPPGWNLLSLISRGVIQLGLSVEATSSLTTPVYPSIATLRASVLPEARSPIEDEERRRLFWLVYLLDRYATVATAFDFALDHREIDRRLPCRDEIFSANRPADTKWFRQTVPMRQAGDPVDVHGHLAYHCELLGILSRIHLFLKSPIDIGNLSDVEQWQGNYRALDGDLNSWHFGLPDEFSTITRLIKTETTAKPVQCGWITVHAAYIFTTIRLNSSAAYPSHSSPIFSSSYSAMQRCLSAVDNMRQLCQLVRVSGLLDKLGPPFAFSVWVCARVALVHGSIMDHDLDAEVNFFITILSEMGGLWEVAKRHSEILARVLEEYRSSFSAGAERVTPSTVKILADMRRCAYDLDFLISRQPLASAASYQPSRANTPGVIEMGYLDVFDLFNFPRLPVDNMGSGQTSTVAQFPTQASDIRPMGVNPIFAQPNPASDWLYQSGTG